MAKNHLLHSINLKCDRPTCGYERIVPEITADLIGSTCPNCGANLLTEEDFRAGEATKAVFDALAMIIPKSKRKAKRGETLLLGANPHSGAINLTVRTK